MFLVAFSTVDRSPFRRFERNFAFFAAVAANGFVHLSGTESASFITQLLFTTFALVIHSTLPEK